MQLGGCTFEVTIKIRDLKMDNAMLEILRIKI